MSDKALTVDQCAVELGISRETVKRYLKDGRLLGAFQKGRFWRIPAPVQIQGYSHTVAWQEQQDSNPVVFAYLADDGCQYSPTCLNCILPKCVHDMTRQERWDLAQEPSRIARRNEYARR